MHMMFLTTSYSSAQASDADDEETSSSASSLENFIPPVILNKEDLKAARPLVQAKNPPLRNLGDYDDVLGKLKAPVKLLTTLTRYNAMTRGSEEFHRKSNHLKVALLESGIKVLIKNSRNALNMVVYKPSSAFNELLASRLGRLMFNEPTIPPCVLLYDQRGEPELRQYFIEDALSEEVDPDILFQSYSMLLNKPEIFGRPTAFQASLALFEDFFLMANRQLSHYLFVLPENDAVHTREPQFYGIEYHDTSYDFESGYIDLTTKGDRFLDSVELASANLNCHIYKLLELFKTKSATFKKLSVYLQNLGRERLQLDILFTMLRMLRGSPILSDKLLGHYKAMSEVWPERDIAADIEAMTPHGGTKNMFIKRLSYLARKGICFDMVFEVVLALKRWEIPFNELMNQLVHLIDEETIDTVISRLEPAGTLDVKIAPLSTIVRLESLSYAFEPLVRSLKTTGYLTAIANEALRDKWGEDDPFGPYYILACKRWHRRVLEMYRGRTYDECDHAFQNHRYNQRLLGQYFHTAEEDEAIPVLYWSW